MTEPQLGMEWTQYIEARRAFLAQERVRYENVEQDLEAMALRLLRKITAMMMTVTADSPAEKSHWVMGQCRQVFAEYSDDLKFAQEYEKAQKQVEKFDLSREEE